MSVVKIDKERIYDDKGNLEFGAINDPGWEQWIRSFDASLAKEVSSIKNSYLKMFKLLFLLHSQYFNSNYCY